LDELQTIYQKNENVLHIFGNGVSHPDVEALREQFQKTTDEAAVKRIDLQRQVEDQRREILRLELEVKRLQDEVTPLQEEVTALRPWKERIEVMMRDAIQFIKTHP
jgi:chromosome segregation ATPase